MCETVKNAYFGTYISLNIKKRTWKETKYNDFCVCVEKVISKNYLEVLIKMRIGIKPQCVLR